MAHATKPAPRWGGMLKHATARYEHERATAEGLGEEHTNHNRDLVHAYNELARGVESLVRGVCEELERQVECTRRAVRKDTQTVVRTVALVRQEQPAMQGERATASPAMLPAPLGIAGGAGSRSTPGGPLA
jgi:hypothetical protein